MPDVVGEPADLNRCLQDMRHLKDQDFGNA